MKTLKEFADLAGCVIVKSDGNEYGGRYGYRSNDIPNSTTFGFKSKKEALNAWARDTFGEEVGSALINFFCSKSKKEK